MITALQNLSLAGRNISLWPFVSNYIKSVLCGNNLLLSSKYYKNLNTFWFKANLFICHKNIGGKMNKKDFALISWVRNELCEKILWMDPCLPACGHIELAPVVLSIANRSNWMTRTRTALAKHQIEKLSAKLELYSSKENHSIKGWEVWSKFALKRKLEGHYHLAGPDDKISYKLDGQYVRLFIVRSMDVSSRHFRAQ